MSTSLGHSHDRPVFPSPIRAFKLGVLALSLGVAGLSQAQVTFFDTPPSAEELRRALMGPGGGQALPPTAVKPADRPSGVRTRGIVWQQKGGVPSSSSQPSPAAASAAAPIETTRSAMASGPAAGMPINFSTGSARIERDSLGFIETVAQVLRSDPGMQLVIEGHTDSSGSYKRNMVLSWDRAMGVYRILVETYGIEPARLIPVGKGPTEPMPGTTPEDGSNRRVQFRLNG